MRNNLCDHVDGCVHVGLVNLAKNKKSLSEEINQKVEAVAEVEND